MHSRRSLLGAAMALPAASASAESELHEPAVLSRVGQILAALHEEVDAGRLEVPDCGGDWRKRNCAINLLAHLRARGLRGKAAEKWLGPYLRWRYGRVALELADRLGRT